MDGEVLNMKNQWTEQVKENVKSVCTAKRMKAAVAVLVICAIAGAGGSYYFHQQRVAQRMEERQAQSKVVAYEASRNHVNLLSEEQVRAAVAQAVGQDESSIQFKEIALENKDGHDRDGHDKDKKDKDKHQNGDRKDKKDKQDKQGQQPAGNPPQQGQPGPTMQQVMPPADGAGPDGAAAPDAAAGATTAAKPDKAMMSFHPSYEVECTVGNIKYEFNVDAVSGDILRNKVKSEHSLF
jgi:uncharacterized membrane protein YkoI